MKFCPYCGFGHSRARAKYCCPEHARASARQQARAIGKLRSFQHRLMLSARARSERSARWRDIAMGRRTEEHLAALFPPGSQKRVES